MTFTYRLALLGLILGTFAWRIQGLTIQSLWRDEIDAIYFALRNISVTAGMFMEMAQNGPLYFLSLRPWFALVGASEFALRYTSVFASTLAIPLTWLLARRLLEQDHNRTAYLPLLAALFMTINPYQLWYGQEGKMYALITTLALLAHWLWLQGITRGGWRPWLGYLIVVSCAVYSHLLMVIIIPLHILWFLLAWPQSRRHWLGYGAAMAGLTLPYLPLLAWQWPMLMAIEPKTPFAFVPFSQMIETLAMIHSYGLLPPAPWLQLTPILFLALAGILLGGGAIQNDNPAPFALSAWRRHALLVSWLVAPILTIYILSLRQPVYVDRYIIWIAPAFILLITLGLRVVYLNAGLLAKPLTVLLLLYVIGFWGYAGWQEKQMTLKYDLRSGVTYIDEHRARDTLLILQIPHQEHAFRYYTGDDRFTLFVGGDERLGNWAGGLWTNTGQPDEEARTIVDQQMRTLTANTTDLWLMSSEVEMWDARHLMREWLDAHSTIIDQAEFHGVQVRHYRLTGLE